MGVADGVAATRYRLLGRDLHYRQALAYFHSFSPIPAGVFTISEGHGFYWTSRVGVKQSFKLAMNKVALVLLCCLAPWLYGQSLWDLASLKGQYKKIVVPFYEKDSPNPIAMVHVERVYLDHQKRGFFKIGLLPALKAEGVKIELLQTGRHLEMALAKLQAWTTPPNKHCLLEIDNLEMAVGGAKESRLSAGWARIQDPKSWHLGGNVEFWSGGRVSKADAARLVFMPNKVTVAWDNPNLAPSTLVAP